VGAQLARVDERSQRHRSGSPAAGAGRDQLLCERDGITGYYAWRGSRAGLSVQARIWLGVLVGSTIGGFIPALWGADLMSYSGVLFSGIGAFVGLWIGYKTS
jgi:hypothetical protein